MKVNRVKLLAKVENLVCRILRVLSTGLYLTNCRSCLKSCKSCMLLQKNGHFSVGKGSKHIHIRYFFATDKIEKKEIRLIYCPTDKMIADYSTKPLQGAKFVEFRDLMLGIRASDYNEYKRQYIAILKQYELYDESEHDLLLE